MGGLARPAPLAGGGISNEGEKGVETFALRSAGLIMPAPRHAVDAKAWPLAGENCLGRERVTAHAIKIARRDFDFRRRSEVVRV